MRALLPAPLLAVIRRHRRWIVVTALCGLAGSAADIGVTLSIRHLFDRTLRHADRFWTSLAAVLGVLAAIEVAKAGGRFFQRRSSEIAGQGVARDLRVELFAHLVRLPLGFFRRREPGKILLRFVNDLTAIRRFVSTCIADFLADGLAVVALLVAALCLEWHLGLGLLVLAPVQYELVRRLNPRIRELNARVRDQRAQLSGLIQDDLGGIEALKVFRREGHETRRVRERSERMFEYSVAQATVSARGEATSQLINGIAMLFVLGYGGWLVISGVTSRGTLVGFYSLFHHVFPSIRRIVLANQAAQSSRVQIARVVGFLERPPEASPPADGAQLAPGEGRVAFERVDGRVDLQARRGEIVAVLGPTGSGKTRLVEYLLGFRQPASGSVSIDGRDVTACPTERLRRMVAWTAASAPLFQGSVSKNVRLGRRRAPGDSLERSVADSGLAGVVARRRRGMSERVGPGGRRLSGGERALVALARALLVERPILVLDEPFAGLDPTTIEHVWSRLEARRPQTTTLLLTSDAGLAARCDRVVRLEPLEKGPGTGDDAADARGEVGVGDAQGSALS
jgi:ABC-type multidrug transport system fused ATPase/permease subunit